MGSTRDPASPLPAQPAQEAGERIDWFPTSVWRFNVPGHLALNEHLLQFIQAERGRDPGGIGRSSVLGWHSSDKLHLRPEMQDFVAVVEQNVQEVARAHKLDTRQATMELATCWAMVNGKLASSVVHCHPNSFLSGVYYVSAETNSGNIFFQDPRQGANTVACPVTEFRPWTIRQVSYRPNAGGMLIFPSWLYHGVEPNLSDAPRVSISFNYRLLWA